MESLTKSTEGLKAGWVDNDVAVSLLVFAVLVFVAFVCSGRVNVDRLYSHAVWVAASDVDEVMGDMSAEGDDVEAEVGFAGD